MVFVEAPDLMGVGLRPLGGMMAEGAMIRLFRLKRFAFCLTLVLMVLAAPSISWAASAPQSGFGAWLAGFNVGSGALIINPIVILIQWANFLILLIILNKILIKPLMSHMESRDAQIAGDFEAAERDRGEAAGYISQYEDALAEIQRENTEALIALQQEMTEATRKRLDEIRERTSREIEETRQSISAQAKQAASELESGAGRLAGEIATRLAGRSIA